MKYGMVIFSPHGDFLKCRISILNKEFYLLGLIAEIPKYVYRDMDLNFRDNGITKRKCKYDGHLVFDFSGAFMIGPWTIFKWKIKNIEIYD